MAGLFNGLPMTAKKKRSKPRKRLTIKEIKAKKYTPAYEARLIRAARKGKTRQSARGHKPKEHIERKEKEKIAHGGLTAREIAVIIRWHSDKYNPNGYREVPDEDDLVEWSKKNGYASFKEYQTVWNVKRREYVKQIEEGTWESLGMGELYRLQGLTKADDYRWLYYH